MRKILKITAEWWKCHPSHKCDGSVHNTIQCRNIGLDKIRITRTGQANKETVKRTIYRVLHPQADVDRLYWKRAEGDRGLLSVE